MLADDHGYFTGLSFMFLLSKWVSCLFPIL
jgi:hypothetical protein